jgi:hypothetical protein
MPGPLTPRYKGTVCGERSYLGGQLRLSLPDAPRGRGDMRALRSLTLLLALAGSSAVLLQRRGQKRRRELRGARLLGAASGGVAGFHFSSEAAAVRRVVYTAPQQAALVSMAALAGLCFTEVVAHQEHGVARGLRRVGLWVVEVRPTPASASYC